ncbi:MAG: X2-like carbohydrate binding domain-containing protein [Bacteroidales bacterium]|jgi:hypothetical protein|nr:T9SS type A sorting domain-containing protein [Bacteroidales bacterium]MDD4214332.1 X2-like carbohydrate binding domain-containing protein [Bacteroidales bacterium]
MKHLKLLFLLPAFILLAWNTWGQNKTTSTVNDALEQEFADITTYAGDTVRIAFRYEGNYAHERYVDDILIEEILPPVISPDSTTFDLAFADDVNTTITWNAATAITTIADNQLTPFTLIEGTDFDVSGNTLTIYSTYLAAVLLAENDEIILSLSFDEGTILSFTITAILTPPPPVVIANWNFENSTKRELITDDATFLSNPYTADDGITSNIDIAPITLVGGSVFAGWVTGAGGTGTYAANAEAWNEGTDTKYWMVTCSTLGYENIILSSKQRGSNTGPRDFKAQYSTDGTNWTDIPGATITVGANFTSGVLNEVPLPVACNNQSSLQIRWLMTSETSVASGSVGAGGTDRIDDILITGTEVSVSVEEFLSGFTVYPNPSNGNFVIDADDNFLMQITDITGRIISEQILVKGKNTISMTNQVSGIYLLRLTNNNNTKTMKIIIK